MDFLKIMDFLKTKPVLRALSRRLGDSEPTMVSEAVYCRRRVSGLAPLISGFNRVQKCPQIVLG
jgi:hypothetical protein